MGATDLTGTGQPRGEGIPAAPPRLFWRFLNGRRWWLGFALLAAGLAGSAAASLARTHREDEDGRFAAGAARTEGRVMSKAQNKDPAGKTVYSMLYQYQDADGETFQEMARVSEATWHHYPVGGAVAVEYAARQPDVSRLEERERPPPSPALVALGGTALLLAAGGLFLCAAAILRARRRARVVRHGVACLGRVTELVAAPAANGTGRRTVPRKATYHLAYTFTDQRGVLREGQTTALPRGFESRWRPGDSVLVLYQPPDVYRHEVDLYGARADALAELLNPPRPAPAGERW